MSATMADSYPKNGQTEPTTAVENQFTDFVVEKGTLRLSLQSFISSFVCRNTIVWLWKPCEDNHGHEMILTETGKETCMEWEILKRKAHQRYANCPVIGVTDIVCEYTPEAVNIVIDVG